MGNLIPEELSSMPIYGLPSSVGGDPIPGWKVTVRLRKSYLGGVEMFRFEALKDNQVISQEVSIAKSSWESHPKTKPKIREEVFKQALVELQDGVVNWAVEHDEYQLALQRVLHHGLVLG